MELTILYLLFTHGLILFFCSGNPLPDGRPLHCFQNHKPRGRYGPCDTKLPNPNDPGGRNEFDSAEACCAQPGAAGFTANRSGSRCSPCSTLSIGEDQSDNGNPDEVIDGAWSNWGQWSNCSVTCGDGVKTKNRTCTNPAPRNGGANCTGNSTRITECQMGPCVVDGGWSDWGTWSDCSVTCRDGQELRQRQCNNPVPQNGGEDCQGEHVQSRSCSVAADCPIAGGWSEWGEWGPCSAIECNHNGWQLRSHLCNNPRPQYGGSYCLGAAIDLKPCINTEACPVDGGLGEEWGEWSDCSGTCGTIHFRRRELPCNNPAPKNGGQICLENGEEEMCNDLPSCPTELSESGNGGCEDKDAAGCTRSGDDFGGSDAATTEDPVYEEITTTFETYDTTTQILTTDEYSYDSGYYQAFLF